jgi:hypothetical protein
MAAPMGNGGEGPRTWATAARDRGYGATSYASGERQCKVNVSWVSSLNYSNNE